VIKHRALALLIAAAAPAYADSFTCPQPVKQPPRQALVQPWPLLEQIAPPGSWTCLDGVTVGILHDVSGSTAPIDWNDGVGEIQHQHTGRYLFTSGKNTPMLPYFRAPANTKDTNGFSTTGGGNQALSYDHVWNLAPGKTKDLTREAHLVRVRVNEGKGYGGGSLHFLGDQIEVLDGTKAFPLHVADLMRHVLEPLETDKAWRTKLSAMLDAQVKADKQLKGLTRSGKDAINGAYRVTWMADTETLHVTFYGRALREYTGTTKNPDPQAGMDTCNAPPGADCAPRRIPTMLTHARSFGAEFAVETVFDKTGKQLSRDEHFGDTTPRDERGFGDQ
jgi:hypothetical protein